MTYYLIYLITFSLSFNVSNHYCSSAEIFTVIMAFFIQFFQFKLKGPPLLLKRWNFHSHNAFFYSIFPIQIKMPNNTDLT